MPLGFECLNRWGYTYIDKVHATSNLSSVFLQITWVKKTVNNNLAIGPGWYFLHSTETCLVGVKVAPDQTLQYISKVCHGTQFILFISLAE